MIDPKTSYLLTEYNMTSNARKKRRNRDVRPAPGKAAANRAPQKDADPKGCAPSFLSQKLNEEGPCELDSAQKRDEYVLPDNEKEAGGEG